MAGIDANTLLMLQLNNSSVDTSQYASSVTSSGMTFSNTTPEYPGTYYGVFTAATPSYIEVPSQNYFNFGSSSWTIDAWVNFATLPTSPNQMEIVTKFDTPFNNGFQIGLFNISGVYKIDHYSTSSGTQISPAYAIIPSISTGTWYHLAVVANGTTWTVYWNGTSIGSGTATGPIGSNTNPITLGRYSVTTGDYLNGWMQGCRISNIARWTSNFTPPTTPYTSSIVLGEMNLNTGYWGGT